MPRLPVLAAEQLLEKYLMDGPHQWSGFKAHELPEAVRFTPTGGSPISSKDLEAIRTSIVYHAKKNGYGSKGTRSELANFDAQTAAWLADQPVFASGEALRDDVWAFIAIVALPDITHWRFGISQERYLGGVRNAFQRLWLRGKLFDRGDESSDRWGLLEKLTEDAFVQIIERPSIGGDSVLTIAIAEAWVRASLHHGKGPMENLTRRAMLQLRARNEVRCLDELPSESLAAVLDTIFEIPPSMPTMPTMPTMPSEPANATLDKNSSVNFNGFSSSDLILATTRLLAEARRYHLLSPKSTAAMQSILTLNLGLTASERNALQHLLKRLKEHGQLETEISLVGLAVS